MSHHLTHAEAVSLFDPRREAWLEENAEAYLALWAEDMEIEIPGREIVRGKLACAEIFFPNSDLRR